MKIKVFNKTVNVIGQKTGDKNPDRKRVDSVPDKCFDIRRNRKYINRYRQQALNGWKIPTESWDIER